MIYEMIQTGFAEVDCVFESNLDLLHDLDIADGDPWAQANMAPTLQGCKAMTIDTVFQGPSAFMSVVGNSNFPIIFDTGASLAISGNHDDFVGEIVTPKNDLRLGGMANGIKIAGIGIVHWTFVAADGSDLVIRSQCYYVPEAKVRLISPQRLFKKSAGIVGEFICTEDNCRLEFANHPPMHIEYCSRSNLPIAYSRNALQHAPQVNLCVLDDENQNLTPSMKLLLLWHYRFGHRNMHDVRSLLKVQPFGSQKFMEASRCDQFKCEVCEFAKSRRRPTGGKTSAPNPDSDGALKRNHLRPGAAVSVDHFESRLRGRTYTSYGKTTSEQYVGGCIFVDHASGYLHVEHQLGFSAAETIRAKQNYEQFALGNGVIVTDYLADNGTFKANKFVAHLREHNQQVKYCGVNAHHQNGVAERSILTVSNMARAMLLHASMRWKQGIDSSLWPMAVNYATHVYNHLPNEHGIAPADIFTGTTVPRHKLRDLHVWGCPVFVLDPKLQQGQKLPRWQPRSRRGVFVGLSSSHSSDVPLVLNLQTGSISSQFHVVFDNSFSTVPSMAKEEDPPDFWEELCLEGTHRIPLEKDASVHLPDDWLTPAELESKHRDINRQERVRRTYQAPKPKTGGPQTTAMPPSKATAASRNNSLTPEMISVPPSPVTDAIPVPPTPATPLPVDPSLRRSGRTNKGTFTSTKYVNEVFLTSVHLDRDHQELQLAYLAELHTDFDTGILNINDPRAYAAKTKQHDPDMPSFHEAMNGENVDDYVAAMKKEITQLVKQNTWEVMPRSSVPQMPDGTDRNILKGTWAFKLKRLPDGKPSKFKARYCCRGDMQREGVDFFETYAPVVQWSTVRMLLTMTLCEGWTTKQVDYTNAFAQADLADEVYLEQPRGFASVKNQLDNVLRLKKSLYGLRQAPRTFFEKLKAGLLERGFTQSKHDLCLFMKKDIICVVYVDDTILAGPDPAAIEREIKGLGVSDGEQRHEFELRDEGAVGDFLGIRIEKRGMNKNTGRPDFYLTQPGLIEKVLLSSGMQDSRRADTPACVGSLGTDIDGEPFNEEWEYASIVGMLMYLAGNSRPDIAFAVNQAARFTHSPKQSHAVAVKRILRYLNGTTDKGMMLSPSSSLQVDCYVDADFAGLWGVEHDQDPVSVKSRTGYLIMFMGCPLLWVSKLQTQIALSTMESEYIALSQSMRDLIGVREILKEVQTHVLEKETDDVTYRTHSKAFEEVNASKSSGMSIPQSTVHEDNQACLKFATMPKMSPRTKHIAVPYHFFRSKVMNLEIQVVAISTDNQLGDQFTKGLPPEKFVRDRKRLMGW